MVQQSPGQVSVATIRGRIYPAGEPSLAVPVALEFTPDDITLTAKSGSLGAWPRGEVQISRDADCTFVFCAEGDRLTFDAERPSIAARLEQLIGKETTDRGRKPKWHRRAGAAKMPRRSRSSNSTTAGSSRRRSAATPVEPPIVERAQRHTPTRHPATPPPEPPAPETPAVGGEAAPLAAASAAPTKASIVIARAGTWVKRRTKLATLWVLDHLRQTDIFVLDRIPVVTDDMRLGADHQHDFERRAAYPGVVREVCRQCGKVHLAPADVPETSNAGAGTVERAEPEAVRVEVSRSLDYESPFERRTIS